MSSRWSSEFNVTEHKDLQATSMAMDRNGDYILLAGKRHIGIKNLNYAFDTMKKYSRNGKYEVGTAEWNPTAFSSNLCALSTNQKIEIFTWKESDLTLTYVLKFHTRLVCSLNWHRFDPNLLASASADTFTHIWDLRDLRKPCLSFSAIAACDHVKWNKLTTHLLATAHDGDIRIWDQRKGSAPIQYISPHLAKIHGLDWSQTHEYQLASCSQDGTVKFFDVTNPNCAESIIQTSSPIWRARYTPFGEGLMTIMIPLSHKGENGLSLWNLSNQSVPVHTFVGHTDVILEFEWRKNRNEVSDYQLITWSKDQSLRIWRIEPFLQKLCGYDFDGVSDDGVDLGEDLNSEVLNIPVGFLGGKSISVSPSNEPKEFSAMEAIIPAVEAMNEISFSNFDYFQYPEKYYFSPQEASKSLELEFSLLSANDNLPHVKVNKMSISDRICIVTVSVNSHTVTLKISFPLSYPTNAAPSFQIEESSTIDDILKTKILRLLKQTAQQRVKKNRICLDSCLAQLIATLEHSIQLQETEIKPDTRLIPIGSGETQVLPTSSYFYETVHDLHIPYPKTCGARFCSVDKLVCFYQLTYSKKIFGKTDAPTPRSFSAVAGNKGISNISHSMLYMLPNVGQNLPDGSVSYFLPDPNINGSHTVKNGIIGRSQTKSLNKITVYDCSKLFFAHKELGEKYILDVQHVKYMCYKNSELARSVGRLDLIQIWTLVGLIAASTNHPVDSDDDISWANHPFFKSQIEYLIMHYAKNSDVQTAAMLCCLFTTKPEQKNYLSKNVNSKSGTSTKIWRKKWRLKPGGSPYHTIHPADTSLEGWNFPSPKHNRSNSWSDSMDDLKCTENILEHKEAIEPETEKNKLLDDKNAVMYNEFKRKYADLLHRWNLLESRAQVAKFLPASKDSSRGMEFLIECLQCKKTVLRSPYCSLCKKIVLRCAICRILVRGSSNFCFLCGHGGHAKHIIDWFKSESVCPTGCGCKCITEILNLFDS